MVAGLAALGVVAARHGTDEPARRSSTVTAIPTEVARRWKVAVAGQVTALAGSPDLVVAATVGATPTITAMRADTGTVLWTSPTRQAHVTSMAVYGNVVVYASSPQNEGDEVVGLDGSTGASLWSLRTSTRTGWVWVDPGHVLVARLAPGHEGIVGVDLLAPADGTVTASIDGGEIRFGDHVIQRRRGDTFELFDDDTLAATALIELASLHGRDANIARTSVGIVAATHGELQLLDDGGAVVTRTPIVGTGDPRVAPFLSAVTGRPDVVVATPGALTGFGVAGGGLATRWTRQAQLLDRRYDGDRPLLVVLPADPDAVSGQDAPLAQQDAPAAVLDATTGDQVWTGTMAMPTAGGPVLTANGFVGTIPRRGDAAGRRAIAGIGLDGHRTWSHTVEVGTSVTLIGTGIIEYGATGGDLTRSTIALLR